MVILQKISAHNKLYIYKVQNLDLPVAAIEKNKVYKILRRELVKLEEYVGTCADTENQ